tara:strand:+ start:1894 stop:2733 length:840 start_codon:yes stop_codon:yes gene_type:complete
MNIGIVGLGMIGGSIGLKLQSLNHTVYGLTNNASNEKKAKERKLANFISQDYAILKNCSIIILALPIKDLLNPSTNLIKAIPAEAIVTDVGSVKVPIIETWEKIHDLFVGSHPMAGTEEKGVDAGMQELFDNSKWIITPTHKTDQNSLDTLSKLFNNMGCNVYFENPEIHDQAVAYISHLPIYLASCLIETAYCENNKDLLNLSGRIAATGFSDTSRVGGGNPRLGQDLAENNTINILKSIKKFKKNINEIEKIIEDKNWDLLEEKLQKTKDWRKHFCE